MTSWTNERVPAPLPRVVELLGYILLEGVDPLLLLALVRVPRVGQLLLHRRQLLLQLSHLFTTSNILQKMLCRKYDALSAKKWQYFNQFLARILN